MPIFFFPLKTALVIPSTEAAGHGLLVFLPGDNGFTYKVSPDPVSKSLNVSLFLTSEKNPDWLFKLAAFDITEAGFPTGVLLNQQEVDDYANNVSQINADIAANKISLSAKYAERAAFIAENEDIPLELSQEIFDLEKAALLLADQRNNVGDAPTPEPEIVNKYSEVINYFDRDGSITADGIEWAKGIRFAGLTIGDYINQDSF